MPRLKTVGLLPLIAFLALPAAISAGVGAETSSALKEIQLDPDECYRVRDLEISRGDVKFYFTDGFLIFSKPVLGEPVALVFSTAVEAGDGEVLLLPPNHDERQVLSAHTKAPNLDEHIKEAIYFFSDNTASELKEQIKANEWIHRDPARGAAMAAQYGQAARGLISSFGTRLIVDLLNHPHEENQYFAAILTGKELGPFEVLFDPSSPEQVKAGGLSVDKGQRTFDLWTSYTPKSLAGKITPQEFRADRYRIDAGIDDKLHMQVSTTFVVSDLRHDLRALDFDLSRQMLVRSAEVDGHPAEIVGDEGAGTGGDDQSDRLFVVVPGDALHKGSEHTVKVVHEGDVISEGANHVYFVGSRGRWYPHRDLDFARFDLKFRFPKNLDLVAPGDEVRDSLQGDERVVERHSDIPLPMAGFNLGQYDRTTVERGGYTVDLFANKSETEGAAKRSELGNRVADVLEFYARRLGPPPLKKLIVSPIPGRFGQGFGGLIYLSNMAYMNPSGKAFSDTDPRTKLFFTRLMQAHEVAHQWWGNLVSTEGYHDEWIMEALANYTAMLYLRTTEGDKAADILLNAYRDALLDKNAAGATVESAGPVTQGRRVELEGKPDAWIAVMYGKGAWIMHMLHARMGDEAFWKMLGELRRRYEYKNLTTDNFRALCAEFMPQGVPDRKLEAFFDQWVTGTGLPGLQLAAASKGAAGHFEVTGTLTERGDFSADVPVDVDLKSQTVTKWVRPSGDTTAFRWSFEEKPSSLKLGVVLTQP
jgi:hypothetical protein